MFRHMLLNLAATALFVAGCFVSVVAEAQTVGIERLSIADERDQRIVAEGLLSSRP